jgi:spore maturation protein CgeB
MAQMGYCPSGRLFEAAACGTPILSDYWEGLEHFFDLQSEILVANSSDDAIKAISLADEDLDRIGRNARERVLQSHTAHHRAAELESILVSLSSHSAQVASREVN